MHYIEGVPSELRPWMWEYYLADHPDRDFILDGVKNGFKIVTSDVNDIDSYEVDNYVSAENMIAKPKLDELLGRPTELLNGKISHVNDRPKFIHAYGAVPKKNTDKLRPITDCSRPFGKSINDNIKNERYAIKLSI